MSTVANLDGATDPELGSSRPRFALRRRLGIPAAQISALIGLVIANAAWVRHFRFGLPFNIDEAGYLQRAIAFGQSIRHVSPAQVVDQYRTPDIVAPLLPLVSGLFRSVAVVSPWALLDTQQLFYAALVVSTYAIARTLTGRGWSTLIALVAACAPGVLVASHFYYLAEPAAAMFTVTLAVQVRTRTFERRGRSLAWGVLLGVTTLTRTMVLGIVPALLVVAGITAFFPHRSRRSATNFALGVVVAAIIALSWYWTSGSLVYRYLTQYGYGSQAFLYTGGQPRPLSSRWLLRVHNIVDQDLYFPIAIALFLCVAASVIAVLLTRHRRRLPDNSTSERLSTRGVSWARSFVVQPYATILIVLVLAFLSLSTTSNSGSYFEVVLVPTLIIAAIAPATRSASLKRGAKNLPLQMATAGVAAIACVGASGITLVDQFGLAPSLASAASVPLFGHAFVAFNNGNSDFVGPKLQVLNPVGAWWSNCGGATVSCFLGRRNDVTPSYLAKWTRANRTVVSFVYRYGPAHGYAPVVFFAYQGPLLNTNSVGLTAQLQQRTLPIGALEPTVMRDGVSWRAQLDSPQYGQPNFVLSGAPGAVPSQDESNVRDRANVDSLLRSDGFSVVDQIPIPDATPIEVWWKNR